MPVGLGLLGVNEQPSAAAGTLAGSGEREARALLNHGRMHMLKHAVRIPTQDAFALVSQADEQTLRRAQRLSLPISAGVGVVPSAVDPRPRRGRV